MLTEKFIFYKEYVWEKPNYKTYASRVKKWMEFCKAIKIKLPTKYKITSSTKECNTCRKMLFFKYFYKDKRFNKYRNKCIDCLNKANKNQEALNKNSREWKKRNKDLVKLDYIYYRDPIIQNNIKIIWKQKKDKAKYNKYYYFINKWYDKEFLLKIYNLNINKLIAKQDFM